MSKTPRTVATTKRAGTATKKAAAKKAPAKKAAVKKAPARKSAAAKTVGKKAAVKKAPVKKTGARKSVVKKAPTTRGVTLKKPTTPRLPADVKMAVAAAQDKLALDVTVLDLRQASAFTDFFIVCTGANKRQVQAISDGIEASLKTIDERPALVEGYRRGEWILLDYFSFIVHVFLPAQRAFYALERLWGGAEPIEVPEP
ncbi:MAG: ribosome silencing factor [Acidobacteria bacterium]|nr:ribosome silencing factor [Acidobacteriota bacterium]